MKLISALVLSALLLSGCGGGDDCTTNQPSPTEEAQWRQSCPLEPQR